jgi:DNA-binding IscR family transcriptional regulator
LIESQLGRGGGYRLKGDARQISLLAVVEAIDGPIEAAVPVTDGGNGHASSLVLLRQVCARAADHTRESLATMSIEDLAFASQGGNLAAAS